MKIEKKIFNSILFNCSTTRSEIGGILGGSHDTITQFEIDKGLGASKNYMYIPNIEIMNNIIMDWQNQNIEFYGIFHSHPDISERLSSSDEEYIREIMASMPDEIEYLYFPLVLPRCGKIIAYKAIRQNSKVNIIRDDVEIIEKGGKR